jgi:undecaprenyl phosphate N,N'-diacetylbacillosamine 1-phosphate transferase
MVATYKDETVIHTEIPVPRRTFYSKYIKRLLDIIISGCAIVVLSPVLLVICVLELIYHGRPIFYIDQ